MGGCWRHHVPRLPSLQKTDTLIPVGTTLLSWLLTHTCLLHTHVSTNAAVAITPPLPVTALHSLHWLHTCRAVSCGLSDVMHRLVVGGADVDQCCSLGYSPLMQVLCRCELNGVLVCVL